MEVEGKINVYVCPKCRAEHVTINTVDGVTPFLIRCRDATGCQDDFAQSCFYRVDQNRRPRWEWYRPAADDPVMKNPGMKEYVAQGGLDLRRVTQETLERFGFGPRAG